MARVRWLLTSMAFGWAASCPVPPEARSPEPRGPPVPGAGSSLDACATLAGMGTPAPRGPLPDDPALATWTLSVEPAIGPYLALAAATTRGTAPTPERRACVQSLWKRIAASSVPRDGVLRKRAADLAARFLKGDAVAASIAEEGGAYATAAWLYDGLGRPLDAARLRKAEQDAEAAGKARVEEHASAAHGDAAAEMRFFVTLPDDIRAKGCERGLPALLARVPGARLRRVLAVHYRPCLFDNYNSIDGELDPFEPLLRETAAAAPRELAGTFELLAMADPSALDVSETGMFWAGAPFGRVTGDLGLTGNALHVTRDVLREAPDAAPGVAAAAKRQADRHVGSHRRARWLALQAYVEAGAPDGDDGPTLLAALSAPAPARRWALAWLPNELEEHAPTPPKLVGEPALVAATTRAALASDAAEDWVLALDAVATLEPPAGVEAIARAAANPDDGVWRAAVAALRAQLTHVGWGSVATRFAESRATLTTAFVPRLCAERDIVNLLAAMRAPELDGGVAGCLGAPSFADTSFMQTAAVAACAGDGHASRWPRTVAAFEELGRSGDPSIREYAARLARDCRNGTP
jgi:hypothetical protein